MEMMSWDTYLWTTLAAFLTLCTFSFLYKDNPFYKFAEHLVVGTSAGYFAIILWHNGLQPKLFDRLGAGDWEYFIPMILGMMMWTRFSKKLSWVSRWPISMYMGIAAGLAVPQEMQARVIEQFYSTMNSNFAWNWSGLYGSGIFDTVSGFAQILIFVGTLSALFYFFFSKEHTGFFGGVSKFGIWILMLGFGASFGYTVMGRISLFVQRIQVLNDWTVVSWDGSGMFLLIWFITFGVFLVWGVYELFNYFSARGKTAS